MHFIVNYCSNPGLAQIDANRLNDATLNLRQLVTSNNWITLLQQATTFGFVVKTTIMRFSSTMHTAKISATPNKHEKQRT